MLINCVNKQGCEQLPDERFLDWRTKGNKQATHAGLQALLKLALLASKDLWGFLDNLHMQQQCHAAVKNLNRYRPDPGSSKQATALMVLASLMDPVKANTDILAVDGAKNISTFYGYYILKARAMAGDVKGALDCIREYWGGMLSMGATTFWEDFDLSWTENACRIDQLPHKGQIDIHGDCGNHCYQGFRHSLCHGWASGPTAWLTEYVLGIKALKPGCKTIQVSPHLGDLQWARGTFPTPAGIVRVSHERVDGQIQSEIEAPDGVEIIMSK
jgi:hypothetical protein